MAGNSQATRLALQEQGLSDVKAILLRIEKAIEEMQKNFITKEEYFERAKAIDRLEREVKDLNIARADDKKAGDDAISTMNAKLTYSIKLAWFGGAAATGAIFYEIIVRKVFN